MRKLVFLFLFGLLACPLFAEDESGLLNYYDSQTITIDYALFRSFTLTYQGTSSGSLFGIDQRIRSVLSSDVSASPYLDKYSALNLAGNILVGGGIALMVVGPAATFLRPGQNWTSQNTQYGVAALVGGAVSVILGRVVLYGSLDDLLKAVKVYNRDQIKQYQ